MEGSEKNYFNNKITYISFFLSIGVIYIHAYNISVYGIIYNSQYIVFFEKFSLSILSICVPTFFCMSGYLFYYNLTTIKVAEKIKRRFFSLVLPYIVWSVVGFLFFFCVSRIPIITRNMNNVMGPLSVVSVLTDILSSKYNIVLWFLRNLIIFTVLTALFYYFFPNKSLIVGLFCLSFFLPQVVHVTITGKNIFDGYCYYLFGVILGILSPKVAFNKMPKKSSFVSLLMSLLFAYVQVKHPVPVPFYYLIMIARICLFWISFDIFNCRKEPKWWEKISFFIYVSHEFFLESIEKLFLIFLGKTLIGMTIDYIFSPIITFFLIVLLAKLLQKNQRLWKIMSGNR
ncbi:MAG: acyltransferase [Sphaerochaetaceae bacterium]|nr:acyltransferase [Sphaerochaetaceae bacterium]